MNSLNELLRVSQQQLKYLFFSTCTWVTNFDRFGIPAAEDHDRAHGVQWNNMIHSVDLWNETKGDWKVRANMQRGVIDLDMQTILRGAQARKDTGTSTT